MKSVGENSLQLVHQVGSDAGATGAQRMTQSNGTAIHIKLGGIQFQGIGAGQGLGSKGLVDLESKSLSSA